MLANKTMRAMVYRKGTNAQRILTLEEWPIPIPITGESLIRVLACGVCRTDLHIVEGDLPQKLDPLILGHQVVGEIVLCPSGEFQAGERVGLSWMGGTDGTCKFCLSQRENLCDAVSFTGYSRHGGYAEYAVARTDFLIRLGTEMSPESTAPLLCAGMIGFRSLRVAGVQPGQRVGLFGFGASARLIMPVLQHWKCEVYVSTRGETHRETAQSMGAAWVGDAFDMPPHPLDAAVTFAPSGQVMLAALKSLDKGGIVAINAIHLDEVPAFDYDSLLWGERQIRGVANMTRQDAVDFLDIAKQIRITPSIKTYRLDQANEALAAAKHEEIAGSAVLLPLSE